MVAPVTSTDQVLDLTDPATVTDLGTLIEEPDRTWRWDCAACVGRSVGTYPTFLTAYQALTRHYEAGEALHR